MARPPAAAKAKGIGNTLFPPRFVLFLVMLPAGLFAYRALIDASRWLDAAAMAFDLAAAVFLLSLIPLLRDSSAADMRRDSQANDANRGLILGITVLLTLVVMAAITGEMKGAQAHDPVAIAKLIGTLLLTWLFANAMFTLHYAHSFYSKDPKDGGDTGGLDVPGTKTPDYMDFFYFACTLGMTFQTSDISIRTSAVRRVALLHGFAAFAFNIGVIAFTINALGGGSG